MRIELTDTMNEDIAELFLTASNPRAERFISDNLDMMEQFIDEGNYFLENHEINDAVNMYVKASRIAELLCLPEIEEFLFTALHGRSIEEIYTT